MDSGLPLEPSASALIARLAGELGRDDFPTGDHAALRRMDPRAPGRSAIALHKLMVKTGVAEQGQRRWALVIHCLALARGRHKNGREAPRFRAGAVLQQINVSEQRLNQLLAADEEVLFDLLPALARRLDSNGAAIDWTELALLILQTASDKADNVRLAIAGAYARAAAGSLTKKESA